MRQRGFALFEVILAVILMAIAAAGSYTLVKSFRANSSTQQFIRYSTTITQGILSFIHGNNTETLLKDQQLSADFLTSIGIPTEDQMSNDGTKQCSGDYCYVNSGMYLNGAASSSAMGFGVQQDTDQSSTNYFIIAVKATSTQVNQVLQSASSLFSVYCPTDGKSLSGQAKCALLPKNTPSTSVYDLYLVFPKSGDTAPANTIKPPE